MLALVVRPCLRGVAGQRRWRRCVQALRRQRWRRVRGQVRTRLCAGGRVAAVAVLREGAAASAVVAEAAVGVGGVGVQDAWVLAASAGPSSETYRRSKM